MTPAQASSDMRGLPNEIDKRALNHLEIGTPRYHAHVSVAFDVEFEQATFDEA